MKTTFALSTALFAASVFAVPSIEVTGIATNSSGALVVSYVLSDEDAIVTCETFVGGQSVGRMFRGDVNRRISQGARTAIWDPRADGVTVDGTVSAKLTAWTFDNPPDYLAIDLTMPNVRRYYASAEMVPGGITNELYKTAVLLMRRIPAKGVVWRMGQDDDVCAINGSNMTKPLVRDNETPHLVKLTEDYYIAVYKMTHRQYTRLTGTSPYSFKSSGGGNPDLLPVENVSYDTLRGAEVDNVFASWPDAGHAVAAGSVLQSIRGFTGVSTLDLPTEAQWEYACRAGTATALNSGKNLNSASGKDPNFAEVGWSKYSSDYDDRAAERPNEVGLLRPNNWGLYDMHGNVFEKCLDRYATGTVYRATFASGYETGAVTVDPKGLTSGSSCIVRGSSYFYVGGYGRSASRVMSRARDTATKHDGFRLVCQLPVEN